MSTFKDHYNKSLLEEGVILDWLKDVKNRKVVKQLARELGMMGLFTTSPPTMAIYVNKFLEQNFPTLGADMINSIAHFLAKNPQILEMFK